MHNDSFEDATSYYLDFIKNIDLLEPNDFESCFYNNIIAMEIVKQINEFEKIYFSEKYFIYRYKQNSLIYDFLITNNGTEIDGFMQYQLLEIESKIIVDISKMWQMFIMMTPIKEMLLYYFTEYDGITIRGKEANAFYNMRLDEIIHHSIDSGYDIFYDINNTLVKCTIKTIAEMTNKIIIIK